MHSREDMIFNQYLHLLDSESSFRYRVTILLLFANRMYRKRMRL